jgi:U3 small nucleolar RNA-associated protein 14
MLLPVACLYRDVLFPTMDHSPRHPGVVGTFGISVMATQRSSFAKRERDRAKKAKQAAKREARLEKNTDDDEDVEEEVPAGPQESAEVIMEKLAKLHAAFEDDKIEFEDFEEQKEDLMSRIPIE